MRSAHSANAWRGEKRIAAARLQARFPQSLPLIAGMRPATGIVVFVLFALCVAAVFAGKSKGGDGNSKLEKILKDGREARKNQDMQVCCWCFRDCCTFLSGFWI